MLTETSAPGLEVFGGVVVLKGSTIAPSINLAIDGACARFRSISFMQVWFTFLAMVDSATVGSDLDFGEAENVGVDVDGVAFATTPLIYGRDKSHDDGSSSVLAVVVLARNVFGDPLCLRSLCFL